jgi:hypothetical protein
MLNELLCLFAIEISVFWVVLQVYLWLVVGSFERIPTLDPYIPRAKRPPNYLGLFLDCLNTSIDKTADFLSPYIVVQRSSSRFAVSGHHLPPRSRRASAGLLRVLRLSLLSWLYPSSSFRHFCPWRVRSRRTPILAFTSIQAGVARASSVASKQRSRTIFDSDSFDILVDGGATSSISNNLDDFVSPPRPSRIRVQGFNGTTSATQVGTVKWTVLDDSGLRRTLTIPKTYYVPDCPLRLLSPQHYSQVTNDYRGTYSTNFGDHVLFVWNRRQFKATLPLSAHTNVGILRSAPGHRLFSAAVGRCQDSSLACFTSTVVTDDEADAFDADADDDDSFTAPDADTVEGEDEARNSNAGGIQDPTPDASAPSQASERPTLIPFDLDHDDPATNLVSQDDAVSTLDDQSELMRWHYRLGHLPFANIQLMAAQGEIPKRLASCKIPKCQSCLYGKATKKPWRNKGQTNKIRTATKPGGCVSVDQLESPVPGFVGQNKGYFFRKRYRVATIFVDHFSRLSFVYLQESTKGNETLLAKRAFEAYAASFGVVIQNYHADNGRFAEHLFLNHAALKGQTVSLCGVNAHFQNGIAEKRIRDLTERARTSLLHGMNRWPSAVTVNLWPYALRFANDAHNSTPSIKLGRSPLEVFSDTPIRPQVLNFHPPFCPVYVLHNGLQGGGKRPNKWVRRSRVAIYLGSSPRHSRSVALVLSLTTGYVSPQFHLKFDDFFETVQETKALPQSSWQRLARFDAEPSSKTPSSIRDPRSNPASRTTPRDLRESVDRHEGDTHANDEPHVRFAEDPQNPETNREEQTPVEEEPPAVEIPPEPPDSERHRHPDATRRSPRQPAPPRRLIESAYAVLDDTDAIEDYETQEQAEDPIAFAANGSDPDTLSFKDAMDAADSKEFLSAMLKEADAHTKHDHWEVWRKADVPSSQDILPSVWAFKRKRRIDTRAIYKYKARLNIHGGMQKHGINYWETYSPVVNWFSIRLCLIFALLFGWKTRQLDFVLAFPQADVECDLFMQLPRGLTFQGVHQSTHCLKLKKNLYGSKQAGRVWNQHLVNGLVNTMHFKQSTVDECVFYRGTTVLLVYVDDAILCGPSQSDIQDILKELGTLFDITDEGEIDDYLGVKVSRPDADTIVLTQPHLIQQILDDVGMKPNTKTKGKAAPSSTILRRDLDGEPFDEDWNYRSVVGKLNFLEKSTRPEIAYAVHQCARFSSNPKKSHANAIKYLCRYLMGTKEKGLILCADPSKSFEVHVDCDFAGNWVKEDAMNDPSTAKSRTGYIISYGGCPIIWASKLQTEVVLSSTESEYVGLSESLRVAIVMMSLLLEMKSFGIPIAKAIPTVFCRLFEDNAGAIHLAKVPKMRPRTRHINQKYHHFREWVKSGKIEILPIDTEEQPADLLTKPLDLALFLKHRFKVLGW